MRDNVEPITGDNLKLLGADGFSSIKECLDHEYSDCYTVRDARNKIMVVTRESRLDTHMHNGWHETTIYVPYWKVEAYNKGK